jgi:hypothetical protein
MLLTIFAVLTSEDPSGGDGAAFRDEELLEFGCAAHLECSDPRLSMCFFAPSLGSLGGAPHFRGNNWRFANPALARGGVIRLLILLGCLFNFKTHIRDVKP